MKFKIECLFIEPWYQFWIEESSDGEHIVKDMLYKSLSKKQCIGEYHRFIKSINLDYFRFVSPCGEGMLPYCTIDTYTKKMKALINNR